MLTAAVLVGSGALVGCSVSRDDDEPSKARATQSPEATETVTEEPTHLAIPVRLGVAVHAALELPERLPGRDSPRRPC